MNLHDKFIRLARSGYFEQFKGIADQPCLFPILCNRRGDSLLHIAVKDGDADICEYLINEGIPVNISSNKGDRPLHYAAEKGDPTILKILLDAGASPSLGNSNDVTPIHVAAGKGYLEIVQTLLACANPSDFADKYGRRPVHYAAGSGQICVLKYFVEGGPENLTVTDNFGQTVLHWASAFEQHAAAEWLINQGADPLAPDVYGRSSEYFAELFKDSLGRKKPRQNDCQTTLLHDAVREGDVTRVDEILAGGFDINRQDSLGRTALHVAAFVKNRELFYSLKDKCADTKIRDDYNWKASMLLSYRSIVCR